MTDAKTTPSAALQAFYLRDFSFEAPQASELLFQMASGVGPEVAVSLDVNARRAGESAYEIVITIRAKAEIGGRTAYLLELDYGGLARIEAGQAQEAVGAELLGRLPGEIFPHVRALVARTTRKAGFPPLLIHPVDFGLLYRNKMAAASSAIA